MFAMHGHNVDPAKIRQIIEAERQAQRNKSARLRQQRLDFERWKAERGPAEAQKPGASGRKRAGGSK